MSDVPGIYDVIGTGLSSGLSAATQFDPFNVTLTDPAPTTRYRTVAGAIDAVAAGKYQCQSGGAGCLTVNSIVVDVFMSNGVAGVSGASIATKTFGPVTNPGTGLQDWSVTFPFRTSPGAGQFAIPANAGTTSERSSMAAALRRTRARACGRRPSLTTTPSVWITSLQPLRSRRPRLLRLTGPAAISRCLGRHRMLIRASASPAVGDPSQWNADWLSHRD